MASLHNAPFLQEKQAPMAADLPAKKLTDRILHTRDPMVELQLKEKYARKIAEKAKALGVSQDELYARLAQPDAPTMEAPPPLPFKGAAEPSMVKDPSLKVATPSSSTVKNGGVKHTLGNLPPDVKTLDKILRMDKLEGASAETIGQVWNTYHTNRDLLISAVIPAETYGMLHGRTRGYPLFLLPLPRDGKGVEFYLLQHQGHQSFFTSLAEYRTHGSNARPHLTLTHYTDLVDRSGLVLMRGEVTEKSPLRVEDALVLVHGLQRFYVTGGPEAFAQVETFKDRPHEFDYNQLIEIMDRVDV